MNENQLLKQTWFQPTWKKRPRNRRLLNQLYEFDRDVSAGNTIGNEIQNVEVNNGQADQRFTTNNNERIASTRKKTLDTQDLERSFTDWFTRKQGIVVETVKDKIQNAIFFNHNQYPFFSLDNIISPRMELAVRSMNASSGRDVDSVTAN